MDENASLPPSPNINNAGDRSIPAPTHGSGNLKAVETLVNDTTTKPAVSKRARGGFSAWKALTNILTIALFTATLFTLFRPDNLFSNDFMDRMFQAVQPQAGGTLPTVTASPRPRIGLVAGHWGNDSGAVCSDGETEKDVNLRIATMVQELLQKEGYDVDLLKEFDNRLQGYQSLALISIHNDSCDYINDQATGFKVAAAPSSSYPEKATRLTACLSQRYQTITGMSFHYNTVTRDMTEYHAFNEIHSETTAAIIETGFLNLDREILTKRTDVVAQGVASGILCFVRNEDIPQPQVPTVTP